MSSCAWLLFTNVGTSATNTTNICKINKTTKWVLETQIPHLTQGQGHGLILPQVHTQKYSKHHTQNMEAHWQPEAFVQLPPGLKLSTYLLHSTLSVSIFWAVAHDALGEQECQFKKTNASQMNHFNYHMLIHLVIGIDFVLIFRLQWSLFKILLPPSTSKNQTHPNQTIKSAASEQDIAA